MSRLLLLGSFALCLAACGPAAAPPGDKDPTCATDPSLCGPACPEKTLEGTGEVSGNTTGVKNAYFSKKCGGNNAPERTFLFKAQEADTYRFAVKGYGFSPVLVVKNGSCDGRELECARAEDGAAELELELAEGQEVVVLVDGSGQGAGAFSLSIEVVRAEPCETPGMFGPNCDQACPRGEGEVCSGRGVCDEGRSGSGLCACQQGWVGSTCQLACPGGEAAPCPGLVCAEIGGEATCVCPRGFAGPNCDECAPGFFGTGCQACPGGGCSGHGGCDDGRTGSGLCTCDPGFKGEACDECGEGTFGENCTACPGGAATPCSMNGICDEGRWGEGRCVCFPGFIGDDCSAGCPVSASGAKCDNHGTCTTAPSGQGICECEPGFAGVACEKCAPGFHGAYCDPCSGMDEASSVADACYGHGTCEDGKGGTGACTCAAGFDANYDCADCLSNRGGPTCALCPSAGGKLCSGPEHGYCDEGVDNTGKCVCEPGRYGPACESTCPGTTVDGEPCSGVGECTSAGVCECEPGFGGPTCGQCAPNHYGLDCWECPADESGAVCYGHGTCKAGKQGDGTCTCALGFDPNSDCFECAEGYFGPNCQPCPGDFQLACGGEDKGSCDWGREGTGKCTCEYGYWGTDCRNECPGTWNGSVCSDNGDCNAQGKCVCWDPSDRSPDCSDSL